MRRCCVGPKLLYLFVVAVVVVALDVDVVAVDVAVAIGDAAVVVDDALAFASAFDFPKHYL